MTTPEFSASDFQGPDYVLRAADGRYVESFDGRRVEFTTLLSNAKTYHRLGRELVLTMGHETFDRLPVEVISVADAKAGES